jgi:glucokinase
MQILAGDIGGTHTRLALFDGKKLVEKQVFDSQKFSGLIPILEQFVKTPVSVACFGVAGPVRGNRVHTTNLPWVLDGTEVARHLRIDPVFLLNDLVAHAFGIEEIEEKDLCTLQKGEKQKGNRALIAAGTGLGEAGLYFDGQHYHPFASEGGHVDFAPRTPLESELWLFMKKKGGHVSYERVLSGDGIYQIYQFLIETRRGKPNPAVRKTEDLKPDQDATARQAIEMFVSIYGAETGNLALKFLSLGGIYLAGGIATHFVEELKKESFLKAFLDKGRFQELLRTIPIHIIVNEESALLGAAAYARKKG